nr:DUF4111 domain-containing protein [Pseudoclavibacter endophyticus]
MPLELLRRAQLTVSLALVNGLPGDERNVLLTLARALHTVETGDIVSKQHAADSAARRMGADAAELLRLAAAEHRGEFQVDWGREADRVSTAAKSMFDLIHHASTQR